MVVLCPTLPGEETRRCDCGHVGLVSPIPERSSYYPHSAKNRLGRYRRECRECERAKDRERPRRRGERRRGLSVETELRRIDKVLEDELMGIPLPSLEEVQNALISSKEALPIEPFRAWVIDQMERVQARNGEDPAVLSYFRIAALLGVPTRRISTWLFESRGVDFCTVDRAASRHGATTPEEIYRDFGNGMTFKYFENDRLAFVIYRWAPGNEKRETREARVITCHSPRCEETVADGSRFCGGHGEVLAGIRASLDADAANFKKKIGRKGARSTCCNPTCCEPRYGTERYCSACIDDGWDEDDIV